LLGILKLLLPEVWRIIQKFKFWFVGELFFSREELFEKVPLELPSKLFETFFLWYNRFHGLLLGTGAPAEVGPMSHFAPARDAGAHR
jgi:hypothetical protein